MEKILGLLRIFPNDEKKEKDKAVVFVHGLNGDAIATWKRKGERSFPELLSQDEQLGQYDIYTFGYRTGFFLKQYDVKKIAELLATEIMSELKGKDIHFIVHSQGGLIIQRTIIDLMDRGKKELVGRVKGIVYLAVPFEGAIGGTIASSIGLFVPPILGKWLLSVQVLSLKIFSEELRDLRDRWNESIKQGKLHGLREKVIIGQRDKTVNPFSSKPPYIDDVDAVDENHRTICKVNPKHRVYILVTSFLKNSQNPVTQDRDLKSSIQFVGGYIDPIASDHSWGQEGELNYFPFSNYVPSEHSPNHIKETPLVLEQFLSRSQVEQAFFSHIYFPKSLIDQKIEEEVDILRKSRFFVEFNTVGSSLALARMLIEGELSGGTDAVRSKALAWCARILVRTEELEKAKEYLKLAKELGSCTEIVIADAFISSQKGNKEAALKVLAHINSPLSRSAALMVVAHHEDAEGAVVWLKKVGCKTKDLDPDGKYFLITQLLKLSNWDDAKETADALTDQDFEETPALRHMFAMTYLLTTVPIELRALVLNQLPFDAASFRLASDTDSIHSRRISLCHFIAAAEIARQLNCPNAAIVDDEYALWLKLIDPEKYEEGIRQLETKLGDPNSALRLVHLALQFGVKLDLIKVEQEIDRQTVLNGGITEDAALARFALAFTQKTPEDVANYVARHYEELSKHLDKISLRSLQIEMLSHAGFPEKANDCLKLLLEEGLSEVEKCRLIRVIAEAEGADPVEIRMLQFSQTGSLGDLVILVDTLESKGDWERLCEYGEILFDRTRTVQDAERLANALSHVYKTERVVELIRENLDLLAHSKNLHMIYCWALYHEGELLEARSELLKLTDDSSSNYRALKVNIAISLGDWHSLFSFLVNECQEKDKRSAHDLISTAQLALHLGSPYAKELMYSAADKANDDAGILATAYFLATNAGWESDEKVSQWLHKAALLSGDDGPIQQKSLKEILDTKPEWDRRESETWQLLSQGEIPQFLAAKSLNKSLIGLMLYPALANLSESDPRRRSAISAYSGKRQQAQFDNVRVIGLDATALLTLGFLNMLDHTLDAFDEVHVPHSTLKWLFEEKQKITFHQPSRIRGAHQIRHMLVTDVLEKFIPTTVADSDLSAQVGDELASLIAEAEKARDENIQCIVVRSSPVHRLASLMQEEADLTEHAAVMSSCLSVVRKLRQKGQITAEEEKKAVAYLQLHEKPWPHQPEITDGATLYLDDLAITYFLHLGMLEKLKNAGFRLIVSPREVSVANELIAYETISGRLNEIIERVRIAVGSRIESRKIKVGRRRKVDELEDSSIFEHPTIELITLVRNCDAIITDDRFLNQHTNIADGTEEVPVFTTLELIDALLSNGAITSDERLGYRTLLRCAGYFFVPVSEAELSSYLVVSPVKENKVVETAELKAIRESILQVRMRNWLRLPKEAPWLDMIFQVFNRVLKSMWSVEADLSSVRAYSNWILEQLDIRGWAHSFGSENGDNFVNTGRGVFILTLLTPPLEAPQRVKDQYWSWIEEMVLTPIKEQNLELYDWIVEWQRNQISNMVDTEHTTAGYETGNNPYIRTAIALASLKLVPPLLHTCLLEKQEFQEQYGIKANAILTFGDSGKSFQRTELYDAIRRIYSGESELLVMDTSGREWKLMLKNQEEGSPFFIISHSKQRLILPDFAELSPDSAIRLHSLNKVVVDVNLPMMAQDKWRKILAERAFDDDEIDGFHGDVHDTPIHIARSMLEKIRKGQINIPSFVPPSRRYFERLVGCFDGSVSIKEYAVGKGKQLFEQLSAWNPYDGFLLSLYLSTHSELTAEIVVDHLKSEDLVRALDYLERHGDRISQLGAIDIGFRILSNTPEIESVIIRLIKQIRDDDVEGPTSGFKLLMSLFVLVDGELSRIRLFSAEPPFYRRLASLSQAALVHRQLVESGIDIDRFCVWALKNRAEHYYFQSLTDMRLEPRWNPELSSASQLKAEFLSRIMIVAKNYENNINSGELFDLVFSTEPGSVNSLVQSLESYFPGPLEGAGNSPQFLPTEISKMIETQLGAEEVGPLSFTALVNSALIFRIDSHQAELAAQAIKRGSYRLANVENRSQLLTILNGLALVAAVGRSSSLANELRILVRRYRYDSLYTLSIDEDMKICLLAAASNEDLNNWREFVGEWLTERAFGKLEGDDAEVFLSHLKCLCHSVPELWTACGRADAALKAYNAI